MQGLAGLALIATLAVAPAPPEPAKLPEGGGGVTHPQPAAAESSAAPLEGLHLYLRRPLPRSARFVDHGVLALRSAAGTPHGYRFDLQLGLFDHVSIGVTAHWLPGQQAPRVWPVGSLAIWRWRNRNGVGLNLGAHYRPVLFAPVDPETRFVPETHFGLATAELAAGWFSAGLDLGVAHSRLALLDPEDSLNFRRRAVFGGGVFARVGNRRVGLTFDALAALGPDPLLVFELALDLRFGLFEDRPRGGWNLP